MVGDGVANLVVRLQECGFDPREVGDDAWEARCPAHGSSDHALAIFRDEHDHVVLECRSAENCEYGRIIGALGFTRDDLYAETPDSPIGQSGRTSITPASPEGPAMQGPPEVGASPSTAALFAEEPGPEDEEWLSEQKLAAFLDKMQKSSLQATTGSSPMRGSGRDGKPESPVEALASVAWDAELVRSNDGRLFAQVPVDGRTEVYGLRSAAFRDWLIRGYMANRPEPPSSAAIRQAIGTLEAHARLCADVPEVFIRTGRAQDGEGSAFCVDLGDPSGQAIQISDRDWQAVDDHKVLFRRPEGFLPLPMPSRDGTIDMLRPYVNLAEAEFRLMVTWLTAVLRPIGPYPILVLQGEQGAAKSTLIKVLRHLIDPHACTALNPPTSTRNLMATAVNGWLLAYDNISEIPRWLSDGLCQLVYGGAISGRALFTNDDRSFIYAQRPVLLSGIGDFVRWGDLKDRSVFLHLAPIPRTRRRGEDEFWRAFHADRPRILGAFFDAIVGGLRELPSVHLAELPRMADYAIWGEAVGRGLGWGPETFLAIYTDNRQEATLTDLLDSRLGTLLLQTVSPDIRLCGTAADIHARLAVIAGKQVAGSAGWPKTVEKLSKELRRLAPQLRLHGISVTFERRKDGRIITVQEEQVGNVPSLKESANPAAR